MSTSRDKSFKERLEAYREQKNEIPNNIFLIWIGDDIPNTKKHPYLENAFKHKRLNPNAKVEILINKKMLEESGNFSKLYAQCQKEGVILRDIESTCKNYINHDIILKLMENKKDYVWASDILRLSLIYHEGGKYYDTDLKPLRESKESKLPNNP